MKIKLTLLITLSALLWSIPVIAMGAKDHDITIKQEKGKTEPDQLLSNIDELLNHRWPDLFDSGLAAYAPRMNIEELANSYQIEAELPGVKKEDLSITLKDDYLVISGQKKSIKEENKANYRRIERSSGSFYRTVAIPRDIDKEKITAELTDGILKIEIAKTKGIDHTEKKIILK